MLSAIWPNKSKADEDLIDLDRALDLEPDTDSEPEDGRTMETFYESRDVPIPDDFLTADPADLEPMTVSVVDWEQSNLREFKGYYAVVLDNVISPSECKQLIQMAEDSVLKRGKSGNKTWRPAMVNFGPGLETLRRSYRNSDRIIWDNQTVMDRLWERCAKAPGIKEKLAVVDATHRRKPGVRRWEFRRFNERMRFLKYQGGQFFRRKCRFSLFTFVACLGFLPSSLKTRVNRVIRY
jgi:hypothetical protein